MRIAYVVPSLGVLEGQGSANLELLRRILAAGHEVDVFTSNAPPIVRTLRGVRMRRVRRLPAWQFGNQLLMLGSTSAMIRRSRYDIVHADAGTTARRADVVVVHTVSARWLELPAHVWREPGIRGRHADAVTRFKAGLEIRQARAARAVLANSTMTADDLVARGVARERIHVIPFGVDVERLRPPSEAERASARRSFGLAEDARVVLFVGPHGPRKGLPAVLDAVAAAQTREHLLIAGDVRGGRWLREAARKEVAVTAPGKIDDIRRAYWAADVLVYPSRYDAFGMAVLEAMACALPVVVSAEAGSHEIVGDAGFVLTEPDGRAIRGALDDLWADPARRTAMGRRAREIALGRDWGEAGRIMLDLYERLKKK